jgi:hypothetical protein
VIIRVNVSLELWLDTKDQQQADCEFGAAQVVPELAFMDAGGSRLCFYFEHESAIHEQVDLVCANDRSVVVLDRDRNLAFHTMPATPKLDHQSSDVNVLEEPISELVVRRIECAKRGAGQGLINQTKLEIRRGFRLLPV